MQYWDMLHLLLSIFYVLASHLQVRILLLFLVILIHTDPDVMHAVEKSYLLPRIIPSFYVYHHFYLEDLVSWLLFILVSDTQSIPIVVQERL